MSFVAMSGTVRLSFLREDHRRWFRLDGRAISQLPDDKRDIATQLFSTHLPDARGKALGFMSNIQSVTQSTHTREPDRLRLCVKHLPRQLPASGTTSQSTSHTHHTTLLMSGVIDAGRAHPEGPFPRRYVKAHRKHHTWQYPTPPVRLADGGTHTHTFTLSHVNPVAEQETVAFGMPRAIVCNAFVYL